MKLIDNFKKMNQYSIEYQEDIQEHICTSQQAFSACLCLFFIMHAVVLHILDFAASKELYTALAISSSQLLITFIWYLLFRYYFPVHKKHTLAAAHMNIFLVVILFELQYFLYNEYISYNIIICTVLCTSLTVIGHMVRYITILAAALGVDTAITVFKNYEVLNSIEMKMYIIDNLFVLTIAAGINCSISWLKYRDFEKKKQIIYLSQRDCLTGLLNRNALENYVKKYAGNDGICSMILLDLDNFKKLNDSLGHYEGDSCLCRTADELTGLFDSSFYVSRLGGDEFVIFMPYVRDVGYVMDRVRLLLEKIPEKYTSGTDEISVTCSVGVAFLKMEQDDLYEKLYKAADTAMYKSKAKGKNTVTVFENEFSSKILPKSLLR